MNIHMHRQLAKIILLNYPLPEYFQNNFQKPTTEIFLRPKLAHNANYFAIDNMKCLYRTLRISELLVHSTVDQWIKIL